MHQMHQQLQTGMHPKAGAHYACMHLVHTGQHQAYSLLHTRHPAVLVMPVSSHCMPDMYGLATNTKQAFWDCA